VSTGRAFVVYTSLRIILLLAVGGLLYLTGARGFLLILLAFLVSGALSFVWLDRPRAQVGAGMGRAIGRVNDKIDKAAAAEDVDDSEPAADVPADSEAETQTESQPGQQ